jgi:flagellar motility protein MotE (MotC chaperone)
LEGASYEKKTTKSMCDELGDEDNMTAYVEAATGASLCGLDGTGCDDRSKGFIQKWTDKDTQDQTKELERLQGLLESTMKEDLKEWVKKRRNIMKLLVASTDSVKEEL